MLHKFQNAKRYSSISQLSSPIALLNKAFFHEPERKFRKEQVISARAGRETD